MSSEVILLRQQLTEAMENANAYKTVKDSMEQKAASLVNKNTTPNLFYYSDF